MISEPGDLYAVLGVDSTASLAAIRHAYRARLRRHHPDTRTPSAGEDPHSHDLALRQVLAAYAVLRDEARRADYDHRHGAPQRARAAVTRPPQTVVVGEVDPAGSNRPAWIRSIPAQPAAPAPSPWLVYPSPWLVDWLQALAHDPRWGQRARRSGPWQT